jgi:hypothetical protein
MVERANGTVQDDHDSKIMVINRNICGKCMLPAIVELNIALFKYAEELPNKKHLRLIRLCLTISGVCASRRCDLAIRRICIFGIPAIGSVVMLHIQFWIQN